MQSCHTQTNIDFALWCYQNKLRTRIILKNNLTRSDISSIFYAKTYFNTGFAYNKPNGSGMLNDRLLYTTGIGLDVLSLYDLRLSAEFSMNQLHEKGLFLHLRSIL